MLALRIIILFLLINSLSERVYSQDEWVQYSNPRIITDIVDQKDYLWISSSNGITRYDKISEAFEVFNYANSQLPINNVTSLVMDKNSLLWIGTGGGGLASFDGANWCNYTMSNSNILSNTITALEYDSSGCIWIGTNKGVNAFDSNSWTQYSIDNSGLSHNEIQGIVVDINDVKWFATKYGLCSFHDTTWTVYLRENSGLLSNNIAEVTADHDGKIWIPGIMFDGENWTYHPVPAHDGLDYEVINTMYIDNNNDLWVGLTYGGLLKRKDNGWEQYDVYNSNIAYNNVSKIVSDYEDNLFLGFQNGKLNKFESSKFSGIDISVLPCNQITCVYIDSKNRMWLGSRDEGVHFLKGDNWISLNNNNTKSPSNYITKIREDNNQNIWVSAEEYLMKYDYYDFTVYETPNSSRHWNDDIVDFCFDKNNNIWVAKSNFWDGGGLLKFNHNNWEAFNAENSSLPGQDIQCVAVDSSDKVWLFYASDYPEPVYGGVAMYDGNDWNIYSSPDSAFYGLYWVDKIEVDKNNVKWIDGISGIVSYDNQQWMKYDFRTLGLGNNSSTALHADKENCLWIGTNLSDSGEGGIVKYDGNSWEKYNIHNSGFSNEEIIDICSDKYGIIWIATKYNGIISYKRDGISNTEETNPSNIVTEFKLSQNYPNPFNPKTKIIYSLSKKGKVTLIVYDILGNEISVLVDNERAPGDYEVYFDGSMLSSGIYFYRIEIEGKYETKKMVLLK